MFIRAIATGFCAASLLLSLPAAAQAQEKRQPIPPDIHKQSPADPMHLNYWTAGKAALDQMIWRYGANNALAPWVPTSLDEIKNKMYELGFHDISISRLLLQMIAQQQGELARLQAEVTALKAQVEKR